MGQFVDIAGQRYEKLVAMFPVDGRTRNGGYIWRFKCDCGREKDIPANSVRSGSVKSCGCGYKHRLNKDKRLFDIWVNMRQRCENEKVPHYQRYGGRGISVCSEWQDFDRFKKWSTENGYNDLLQIDRIDNDGNYMPNNCRWVTARQQQRNRGNNHMLTYKGQTLCIAEWGEVLGISQHAIMLRINRYGYTTEEALTKPVRKSAAKKEGRLGD